VRDRRNELVARADCPLQFLHAQSNRAQNGTTPCRRIGPVGDGVIRVHPRRTFAGRSPTLTPAAGRRNARQDGCPATRGRLQLQGAADRERTFPHAGQADHRCSLRRRLNTHAIVFHDEGQVVGAQFEQHVDGPGAGMLADVVQRFLSNTIDARFDLGRKTLQTGRPRMERGRDPGMVRPLPDIGTQHPRQSELVERRRPQLPRDEIHVLVDAREHFQGAGGALPLRAAAAPIVVESFEDQPQSGQTLAEIVVQLPGESPPLVLLRPDEPPQQPRPRGFGLRAIGNLRCQERPGFSKLAARLRGRRRPARVVASGAAIEREGCSRDRMKSHGVAHSNKEIAARLNVSNKTIEVHKANAMRKLGLRGRIELLQYALHVGWLHDV
jgi:hypothetical protein